MNNNNLSAVVNSMATNLKQQVFDAAIPYAKALSMVQKGLLDKFSKSVEAMSEEERRNQIRTYIINNKIKCDLSNDVDEVVNYMYHDMSEMSFISRENLFERDGFEELNINAWNVIEIVENGKRRMTDYSFLSPQHCIDIHKRIFLRKDKVLDKSNARVTTDIVPGIRISTWATPIVDNDVGIASSIRKVNTKDFQKNEIISGGMMTEEMFDFVSLCLMCKASVCMSGETSAGKTTYSNTELKEISRKLRVITIEESSRELKLIELDENGKPMNSVIHTKTIESEDQTKSVTQRDLIKDALRMHPDIISPAEVRDAEAFDVMEAANTGHGVLTTVHSNGTLSTPQRFISLAKKAFDMDDATLYSMFVTAFPILVHFETCPDGVRRLTEIREVYGYEYGELKSTLIYEYDIEDNIYENGECIKTIGEFKRLSPISFELTKRLLKKGATKSQLVPYMKIPIQEQKEG